MSKFLYSIGMITLGKLLGSAARTEVLQVLFNQPGALGLRQTARIAAIHPRSAELALRELATEGLVKTTPSRPGPLYEINRTHPHAPLLAATFAAATQALIRLRSESLSARGRTLLPFLAEASRMLATAKRSRHES